MKRTLKAEAQRLERYLGLPPDPRLYRLIDMLDAEAEQSCALAGEPSASRLQQQERPSSNE